MQKNILKFNKNIWTEQDFAQMEWHNCIFYGFCIEYMDDTNLNNNLLIDLDYIFEENSCTFLISPATLSFKNISNLIINIDYKRDAVELLEIINILLKKKIKINNFFYRYEWEIVLRNGYILLESSGYDQILRKPPILSCGDWLGLKERGGISFSKDIV